MEPDGTTRRRPERLVAWLALVLALTTLSYLNRFLGDGPPDDFAYSWSASVGTVIQSGIMLGILLLIARGLPAREVFALRRPPSWPRALGYSAAALGVIWVGGAVLVQFLDATDEQGLVPDAWDSNRIAPFAAFFVAVTVVAPAIEELTYRGVGFWLLAPYGTWVAIFVTGVLFGAAHGLLLALPILSLFGIAVGWLRAKTDSVYPSIILHGIFNGVALIASVAI